MKRILEAVTLAALASTLAPTEAGACGGFFCSQVPVDQSGEQVVFTVRDGKVEAHVQIQYVGEAQDFAWIVPVHGVPTLGIGAPAFFGYLSQMTRPQFRVTWVTASSCVVNRVAFEGATGGFADAGASAPGVEILEQSQVGPYDYAILAASDASLLKSWLTDNGYDLGTNSDVAIDPYVGQGYNFVALKLQKDREVGELRPIVLSFDGTRPCVPIRLTAVAARPDMPIVAWVFADHRAVPINYRHVLINETRVDWVNFGSNYSQVASRAVDEAGGQAFLTEFAGATQPLSAAASAQLPGLGLDTSVLETKTHPVDFVVEVMSQGFPRGDGALLALFRRYIPMPKALEGSVSEQAFYNSIDSYRAAIDSDPGRPPFDAVGLAREIEASIVAPLQRAHQILATYPYVTRLFTTMSAEEMTVDPEFEFNASAPRVSNVHSARARMICEGGQPANVQITLEDGRSYRIPLNQRAVSEGPFAERVEQYTAEGPPAVIVDNAEVIAEVIGRAEYRVGASPCGCGAGAAGPVAALAIAAVRLALSRRRRRQA